MRARQGNTLEMFQRAFITCTRYVDEFFPKTPEWTVPRNFPHRLEEFRGVVAEIQALAIIQTKSLQDAGVATETAQIAQKQLRTQLAIIRQAAQALRWEIPGLAEKCRILPLRSRHSAWHERVQEVLDCARPHLAALVDEGVPANTLDRIAQADAMFAKAIADGVRAREERSRATQQLPTLVTRGHRLLASLSLTMRAYHAAYPHQMTGADTVWTSTTHVRRDRRRSRKGVTETTETPTTNDDMLVIPAAEIHQDA